MVKRFEQFDLFADPSSPQLIPQTIHSKKTPPPFPNILLNALSETDARTNAVYYLRIVNKSSQKRLFNSPSPMGKKIFFNSLFNEIKLKQGMKNPVIGCRDAILHQTLLLNKRK